MADIIHGKNVRLQMLVADSYFDVLCGTDCTFAINREFVEKTNPTSGPVRQWKPRITEFLSTVTGGTKIDNDASLTFFYMLQTGNSLQEKTFKLIFENEDGDTQTYTGPALIGSQSINGPVSDFSEASIEIRWNGQPTTDDIDPPAPPQVYVLYLDFPVGNTSVSHVDLQAAGVEILGVGREGLGLDPEVGGTPAGGTRQFRFEGSTGTIFFDAANPSNGERVWVLYKKP